MSKCPKCLARKGKRFCPALQADICARCCGEHRLRTIRCPQDCPYLGSVAYQQERRQEKATSRGKEFLAAMVERFPDREAHYFAIQLQAEIFVFGNRFGGLDGASIGKALRDLKGLMSKIFVPEGAPHPLAIFILHHIENSPRYGKLSASFSAKRRLEAIDEVSRYIAGFSGDNGDKSSAGGYIAAAGGFFDQVDLLEDLQFQAGDFDPPSARGQDPDPGDGPFRRTAGGLILPT